MVYFKRNWKWDLMAWVCIPALPQKDYCMSTSYANGTRSMVRICFKESNVALPPPGIAVCEEGANAADQLGRLVFALSLGQDRARNWCLVSRASKVGRVWGRLDYTDGGRGIRGLRPI